MAEDVHERNRKRVANTFFFVSVVALVLHPAYRSFAETGWDVVTLSWVYPLEVALFIAAALLGGRSITGHWLGAIIDSRHRLSLSRLQMLLWTSIVVPGLACAAAYRMANGLGGDALEIGIPAELFLALGISAGSFVAAPTILSLKPRDTTESVAVARPGPVQFSDVIRGDEVGNEDVIDLSKLQQLAITIMLLTVYAVALGSELTNTEALLRSIPLGPDRAMWDLPALGQGFLALMAVSHAGYLAYKAAPKPSTSTSTSVAGGETVSAQALG